MSRLSYLAVALWFGVMGFSTAASARDANLAQAQLNLRILGYDPGPIDGAMGGRTMTAFEAFHAERGDSFDGTFDQNDMDALYEALAAVPFNGAPPQLDVATGRTTQNNDFDFVPEADLTALYQPVASLDPMGMASLLREAENSAYCRASQDPFPAAGQPLQTYASFREFETTGRRTLHPGVRWLQALALAVQTSAPGAALGDKDAAAALKAGLLAHAEAGSGLQSAALVDRNGAVIVAPDFGAGVIATQALIASYVVARDSLALGDTEQQVIETWLTRMFETYPDSAMAVSRGLESISQEVGRLGRAMMVHALMTGDADQFNEGARVALTAASFVRADGSERLGASRGNRALFYQGTALMYAMETYVLLKSQGVDAEAIMGPTVRRLADFWGRAWHDHSVLFPYARENEAVYVGSDYRVQDMVQVSPGVDMFLAIAEEGESRDRLLEARSHHPFPRMIGDMFVSTCMAQALGAYEPPASVAGAGGLGGIESSASLSLDRANVLSPFSEDNFAEYAVNAIGLTIDGQDAGRVGFTIFADYAGSKADINNLELLRVVLMRSALLDASSREADYSSCGPVAANIRGSDQQLRLHWGHESSQNDCILDKMGEGDRAQWLAIMVNFSTILDAANGRGKAEELRELHSIANR